MTSPKHEATARPGWVPVTRSLLGKAGQHATSDVPVAGSRDEVGSILASLPGRRYDSASVIAVVDDTRLAGVVTIERLLAAHPTAVVADVMDTHPPTVASHTDQERAAWQAVHHGEPGLAVTDDAGHFVGLIPPQRLLGILLQEHDEDMARLGGFVAGSTEARSASTAPVLVRLGHRLPWLVVGFAGALLAAMVVGAFDSQLEQEVLIALFVPGVVYIADAVGTQTEALVVRGLSVGVSIRATAVREVITGVCVGLILGMVALPTVAVIWGDAQVAWAVAVAFFAASSSATVIAMALPAIIHWFGKDPAYGAGPLSTVIQDLLSLVIYFVAANAIVF